MCVGSQLKHLMEYWVVIKMDENSFIFQGTCERYFRIFSQSLACYKFILLWFN